MKIFAKDHIVYIFQVKYLFYHGIKYQNITNLCGTTERLQFTSYVLAIFVLYQTKTMGILINSNNVWVFGVFLFLYQNSQKVDI